MIKIKFIPNILKDEGRSSAKLEYRKEKILLSYLGETDYPYNECRIIFEGRVVENLGIVLYDEAEIILMPKVGWPGLGAAIYTWWMGLGVVGATLFVISAAITVYSIVAALTTRPRKPSFDTAGDGLDEGSPTYGWDGIRNTQDVGIAIPVIYGEHRVGGNIINQFIRTDGDKQFLNLLIALSEGEIESIDDIEINENPAANFSGITTTKRYGTNSQAVVSNFNDTHNLQALNVNLLKNAAYVHTTIETDITAFELQLTCVGGLYQAGSDGSVQAWDVTYHVEYKLHTDGDYIDLGSTTISALSRTDVRRIYRKDGLAAGQYDIRITKTSDDSSLSPVKQGDLYLKGVDEINQDEPLIYPNVALLGIEALATDQLNGTTPTITSIVKGRKVHAPDVRAAGGSTVPWADYYYDPATTKYKMLAGGSTLVWDGSTYVDIFCANPIWCLRDLLTNTRYGLGDYITTAFLDDTQMLEMAQYCEEKVSDGEGGFEKRFRLDVVIDSATKAMDLLTQLCATFRGFAFYSNGAARIKIDKADTPVQMFGMGNINKSSFIQSWKSIREIPNVIEVQFMDKSKGYKQDTIAIIDEASLAAGDPIRKKELRLFCTRISQCLREGRYALLASKYIDRTITLKAGIDAIACQAGDLINVCHDVPQWGFSGRAQASCTTTKVYLDQTVTLETGKTYFLRIRFADDTQEEKQVTTGAGSHAFVEVSEAFGQAPAAYDLYSLGEINKVVKPFRVVSMRRSGNSEVEINAIEYNASVYDTDTIYLPDSNYSALTVAVPDVENLTLTERLVKLADGTVEDVIDVWFNKPMTSTKVVQFDRAKIYLSDNDGSSWVYKGETYGTHFQVIGNIVDTVTYKVAVVSVGFNGKINSIDNSPQEEITIVGKSAAPSDITTFLVNQSRDRMYFGWTDVTDVDLAGYEIRYGASWAAGAVLVSGIRANSHIELNFREGTSQSYWIKAIDTSGNYSATAKEAVITISNIPFTNIIKETSEQTAWGGTKSHTEAVGDNLELSATYLTGTYITPVINVGYVATFKIGIEEVVTVAGDTAWDSSETATWDASATARFSGEEVAGAITYEIRTSEDNVTWTTYAPYQAGDYYCRYYQIRATLTRASLDQDLEVSELNHYADLPDVDEFGDGEVTVAADGDVITFAKTFHEAPSVNIDILSGDGYVHKFSVIPDLTDFTVKLYDLAGTAKTGEFKYHAHGV